MTSSFATTKQLTRPRSVLWILLSLWTLSFTAPVASASPTERDILGVQQDVLPFARKAGLDTVLLAPDEQAKRDARTNQLFFSPWQQARPSLSPKDFRAHILRKARGYCMDIPWSAEEWKNLTRNTNEAAYPAARGAGIVTRHTDMRSMPTDKPLYMEPTDTPAVEFFDLFQHASLALGTPVYVSHVSADGNWLYVEYPLLTGWVRTADVALVPRAMARAYAKGPYGVVVRDGTRLDISLEAQLAASADANTPPQVVDAASDSAISAVIVRPTGLTYIGSVFPYADAAQDEITIIARNADGSARVEKVRPPKGSVLPKPLPITPAALADLANQMLGQPYGWGGINHYRDCSLAMRDLFLPFGIWLARNSRAQVQVTGYRKLSAMQPAERKAALLRDGIPFMTLLGFPSHVGLYVGQQDGEPIILHTILGLRTHNPDKVFRHLIGKCVVSTLEAGKNQPEVQLRESLLEYLRAMRHIQ